MGHEASSMAPCQGTEWIGHGKFPTPDINETRSNSPKQQRDEREQPRDSIERSHEGSTGARSEEIRPSNAMLAPEEAFFGGEGGSNH